MLRPTVRGWCLGLVGAALVVFAIATGQRDLLRVGVFLVLLLGLALVLARRAAATLRLHERSSRTVVEAGRSATIRLELVGVRGRATGTVVLQDRVPATLGGGAVFAVPPLRPGQTLDLEHRVRAEHRGRYLLGPASVQARDPLALALARRELGDEAELVVLPTVHELPVVPSGETTGSRGRPARTATTAALDDASVREYRDGDDVRRVHWRATARRGEVMVRADERPGRLDVVVVLDDRASAHPATDDPRTGSLEFAVSAAASALSHFARRGHRVRLLHDGVLLPPGGADASGLGELLRALAVLTPTGPTTLARSIAQLSPGEPVLLVAVLGSCSPGDVEPLVRARPVGSSAVAIVCTGAPLDPVNPVGPVDPVDPVAPGGPTSAGGPGPKRDRRHDHRHDHRAAQDTRRAQIVLSRAGWRTAAGSPADGVAALWGRLAESTVHAPGVMTGVAAAPPPPGGAGSGVVGSSGSSGSSGSGARGRA